MGKEISDLVINKDIHLYSIFSSPKCSVRLHLGEDGRGQICRANPEVIPQLCIMP
jgi:hypothetical protein